MTYLALILAISFLVAANLLLKNGASFITGIELSFKGIVNFIIQVLKNPYLLSGIFSYGLGFFVWVFVLSKINLSIAYPIAASSSIVLIALLSWLIFSESLSLSQIFGVIAIIMGIFLVLLK